MVQRLTEGKINTDTFVDSEYLIGEYQIGKHLRITKKTNWIGSWDT